MQFNSASLSDVGRVRSANEDNFGDAQTINGHVFVVCDGMGGHVGGARASSIAVASILQYFEREKYENLIQALDRALVFANEQIYASAINEPELKGMGTTAVVLIVRDDECYIGHVGDSRIYFKSDGKLNRLTKDHSFVQSLVDSGVITDEEAESHPNKNQILKALGTSPNVEPTICQSPVLSKKGGVFLLCSDGMSGMVNDPSMEMMIDETDLDRSARTLIQAALDAGGTDNVTVTLVGITNSPHSFSKFKDFNPIPAFDGTGTQSFGSAVTDKNSGILQNKFIWIGAGVLVVLLSAVIWFMMPQEKANEVHVNPDEIWKNAIAQIATMSEDDVRLHEGQKVDVKMDTTLDMSHDNFSVRIEGGRIVSVDHVNEKVVQQKSKVSKKVEKPKEAVKEDSKKCGDQITYVVMQSDTRSGIKSKFQKNCDSLNIDKIHPDNNIKPGDTLRFTCTCKVKK